MHRGYSKEQIRQADVRAVHAPPNHWFALAVWYFFSYFIIKYENDNGDTNHGKGIQQPL
jgi:hypothetical protein